MTSACLLLARTSRVRLYRPSGILALGSLPPGDSVLGGGLRALPLRPVLIFIELESLQ